MSVNEQNKEFYLQLFLILILWTYFNWNDLLYQTVQSCQWCSLSDLETVPGLPYKRLYITNGFFKKNIIHISKDRTHHLFWWPNVWKSSLRYMRHYIHWEESIVDSRTSFMQLPDIIVDRKSRHQGPFLNWE